MKQNKNSTPQYIFLQAMLWATYGCLFSYANAFLTERLGLTDTLAGIILCLATGVSCLLQPIITALSDRTGLSVRKVLLFSGSVTVLGAGLSLPSLPVGVSTVTFALAAVGLQVLPAFTNALGMACIRSGEKINFGLARGIGSVCFGVAARLAPLAIEALGLIAVPLMGGSTALLFLLAVALISDRSATQLGKDGVQEMPSSASEFFRMHKKYIGVLVAVVLLYTGHNVLSNCMLRVAQSKLPQAPLEQAISVQGTALMISAVLELPIMFLFVRIVKKLRCDLLLVASCLFMTLRLVLSLLLPGALGLYLAQTAQIFGFALMAVSSVYYTGTVIEKRNVVKGQTYLATATTVGCMAAYAIGGTLVDAVGAEKMLLVCIAISVLGSVIAWLCTDRVEQTVGAA